VIPTDPDLKGDLACSMSALAATVTPLTSMYVHSSVEAIVGMRSHAI
jgi:hypothetical protein